jgi:hypothetical protein
VRPYYLKVAVLSWVSSKQGLLQTSTWEYGTKKVDGKDVVWVANRESPLSHPSSSTLLLSQDGNLLLFQSSSEIPFWAMTLTFLSSNITEAVRDDGNFVLRNSSNPSSIFWQSFDHPTNTLLLGVVIPHPNDTQYCLLLAPPNQTS